MENPAGRTRMNLSQTAKGTWQVEVTAEYPTPEQTAENLAKAINLAKRTAAENGLVLVQVAG